jgi:hypothetical protein
LRQIPAGTRAYALPILLVGPDIMVIPPHDIIIGMPMFIIAIIRWQHSMNISFVESSIGIISHFLPAGVMVQVILHIIIGIMPPIMGIDIMPPVIGIMPPIIGIGIIPPIIIGMFIGIIVCIGIAAFISRLQIVPKLVLLKAET